MHHLWILVVIAIVGSHGVAAADGAIRVAVTDGERHTPLAGAHVSVSGISRAGSTDAGGICELAGIPAGSITLRIAFVGYSTSTVSLDVREGETVSVTVALKPVVIPGQPITVTASRGRERETPATFSTLGRQEIRERHTTQDIPVLLSELPSTTYYSESGTGIGYTYLNIRGFDARRVAVMVNGVPQNDPEDHNVYWLDFPDLAASAEDIQVQRGAGSALYGAPAIGGSVNVETSHFARERSLRLSAGLGSYNTRKYSASFSSGLVEGRYAMHARVSRLLSSGYRDRAWADFTSYFLGFTRYDESMTTQLHLYGGPVADGLAYYGIPKADVKDPQRRRANPIARPEEIENFSQPHVELLNEWHLTPELTLNTTVFLVHGDGFFDYDGSWAPYSYYRLTGANGFAVAGDPDTLFLPGALIRAQVSNRQWGILPRLKWMHEGGELLLGGEFRFHRSLHWGRLQWTQELPLGVPYDYHYYEYRGAKDILSVYAHALQDVARDVKVMASLHYVHNRYRLYDEKFVGTDFTLPYHFLNPRLGVNYNFDERWNAYMSVGFTSREPRLKNLYDAAESSTPASWGAVVPQFAADASGRFDFERPLVKPESLLNLELGCGYTSDVLRFSGNVYWMEFMDEIVKSGQVDRFGQPITGNADRTRHLGIELSGTLHLTDHLDLSANTTLSHNRFVRHTDFSRGTPADLEGLPIAGFPDLLANVRLTYRQEELMLSVSGRYVGKHYTDNFRNEQRTVDPFFVSDAFASYTFVTLLNDVDVEARVQVQNLFDVLYAAYGEGDQFFVGAERNVFVQLSFTL